MAPPASPSSTTAPEVSGPPAPAQLATQHSTESSSAERKYVSHACEACRSRRSKCDGQLPTCSACLRRRTACTFSDIDRRRGKLNKNETDALQEKVKDLETIISVLSLGSDNEAHELFRTMRAAAPSPATGRPVAVTEVLREWNKSREKDVEYNAETTRLYTARDLPPERLIHHGIRAYFNCSYTLFHIYEKAEMKDIVDRVYKAQGPIDRATLCELCALTAIGSHYDAVHFDVSVMENLFHTASTYVSDCIEAHFLRGMRVILCLSMYSFMTKRISARHSLVMGLSIARQARLNEQMPPELWIPFRKVYRTFVFMQCWLSSSLGYQPAITEEETNFTKTPIVEPTPTMENAIQAQLSAVGTMMADIVQDVYKSSPVVFSIVKKHSDILRHWEASLPPTMQLAELRKEPNVYAEAHRRSMILVHVMCFGARILLQRRLLVTMAEERMNGRWTLDGSIKDGRLIEQQCIAAAEECVTLLDVLGYTRHMFRRCWLCIGHAFSANSVLLFDVAQRLLYNQRSGVAEQLARSQECINMLEGCGESDRVAKSMQQIVLPLHQQLQRLANEQPNTVRSGIYDLLDDPQAGPGTGSGASAAVSTDQAVDDQQPQLWTAVIPAMQTAIQVLGNPFGHVRRNDVDSFAAGDPSVPSWWN